jgi:LysR family glycine cleavage system transcriptional activator
MNSPRSQPPPSLNALRAFSVTARAGSVARAAEILGVTPSAVGHQIRALEAHLGVRLCDHQANRLTLTQTGAHYAEMLGAGFDILQRATASVQRETAGRPITVSATPAIALKWLAPALDRVRQKGGTEFRIDASSREADLSAGEADLDIRYGRSVEPGLVSEVLFTEAVFPVCNPDYAQRRHLAEPADLARADLLFVDDWGRRGGRWTAWADWFEAAGLDPAAAVEAARFTEMDKAVEAARRGEGVAIGADRHLAAGEPLLRLFAQGPEVRYSAFLVALPEVAENAVIRRLWRELIAIARQSDSYLHKGAF